MLFLYAVDDTSEGAIVQRKGRFKVTLADLSPMVCNTCYFWPLVLYPWTSIFSKNNNNNNAEVLKGTDFIINFWVALLQV